MRPESPACPLALGHASRRLAKRGAAVQRASGDARIGKRTEVLRARRHLESIAKANPAGVYKGRKPKIDPNQVRRLKAEGLGASEIDSRTSHDDGLLRCKRRIGEA
jgi:hypothetical protein